MKITKTPPVNSSAFRDALFKLSAMVSEVVELDIYDHAGSQIIGRKRLYGSMTYDVNVANYAQAQFEIAPIRTVQCAFATPPKRVIQLSVGANGVMASTKLCAGMRTIFSYEKLSASPEVLAIGPEESSEIAVICEGGALRAVATFSGNTEIPVVLASKADAVGLQVFCLHMADVAEKVRAAGLGELESHYTMTVQILDSTDNEVTTQIFQLISPSENSVRICWWNSCGQIDYYTLRGCVRETYEIIKQRVYTTDGYKITGSGRENYMTLVSDFVPQETLMWLSEIAVAPRVWMEQRGTWIQLDVLCDSVVTAAAQLAQLTLTVRKNNRDFFQHQ